MAAPAHFNSSMLNRENMFLDSSLGIRQRSTFRTPHGTTLKAEKRQKRLRSKCTQANELAILNSMSEAKWRAGVSAFELLGPTDHPQSTPLRICAMRTIHTHRLRTSRR